MACVVWPPKREGPVYDDFLKGIILADEFKISHTESFGDAPILVFCDHASNAMPDEYDCLGLPSDILKTHIAWDIGARDVAAGVARGLRCEFLSCGFSRLIIDPNRDLNSSDLIPTAADQIPVPGNQMLSEESIADRIHRFHQPYHIALAAAVDRLKQKQGAVLAVSIHSFTNRLMGAENERPWPVGLLWREDEASARFIMDSLNQKLRAPIGDNQPYDARVFNYSVDRHLGPRGIRHLTLEVRQDLIDSRESAEAMSAVLSQSIGELCQSM